MRSEDKCIYKKLGHRLEKMTGLTKATSSAPVVEAGHVREHVVDPVRRDQLRSSKERTESTSSCKVGSVSYPRPWDKGICDISVARFWIHRQHYRIR